MGEIFGGIIIMGIFIGFIMWKNKGGVKQQDEMRKIHEEQYWAQRNSETPEVVSSDSNDDERDD
jgi:hypothetical protein